MAYTENNYGCHRDALQQRGRRASGVGGAFGSPGVGTEGGGGMGGGGGLSPGGGMGAVGPGSSSGSSCYDEMATALLALEGESEAMEVHLGLLQVEEQR